MTARLPAPPRRLARSWLHDRRAVAPVEFALLAPLMVLAYLGAAELARDLTADRRVAAVAPAFGEPTARAGGGRPAGPGEIFGMGRRTAACGRC